MTGFQELLKNNLEAKGLDYDTGWAIYSDVFKLVYQKIRMETHKHNLLEDKLVISITHFGHLLTPTIDNSKQYKQRLKGIIEDEQSI